MLGCQRHDIPALISARLLKPLGNRSRNAGQPVRISFFPNRFGDFDSKKRSIDAVTGAILAYNHDSKDSFRIETDGLVGNIAGVIPVGSTLYLRCASQEVIDKILSCAVTHFQSPRQNR